MSLSFKFDFDLENLDKVEYKRVTTTDGVTETTKVKVTYITSTSTLLQTLHSIHEFYNAKTALSWTTGPQLYSKFPDILTIYADKTWWLTQILSHTETVPHFNQDVKAFIRFKFSNNDDVYRNHKRFLNQIKKTASLSVSSFVSLVTYHNHVVLPLLPGAPETTADAIIQADDFKNLIYDSMPSDWRDAYEDHHYPYDDSLANIITRMERYCSKANRKSNKNSNHNNNNDNSRSNKSNKSNKQGGRNRNNNRRSNNNQNNQRRSNNNNNNSSRSSNNRVQDSDPCPIHPGASHNWGQCFKNVDNPSSKRRGTSSNNHSSVNANVTTPIAFISASNSVAHCTCCSSVTNPSSNPPPVIFPTDMNYEVEVVRNCLLESLDQNEAYISLR
eukprot:CAMPEP_0172357560 /NCGR_PEP_ID=MMETSP1060-20121228/1921_1 /TAXON_ID=37318 /ORGANISM="Pseudo-nitzschia pungens, Strain cf. cingulata" /LENGTH=386 /DNA_ID=CAMNT_0013078293 /DNA_START=426 /DNA_END=1586 /DNA_ORIENTATION=-